MTYSIDYYRSRLKVSRHDLDTVLEDHSDLYERIGRAVAQSNSDMLRAKDELARTEGSVADRIREDHPGLSIPKVAEMVLRHEDRRAAFREWMRVRERHEEWSALKEAWIARGYNLKTLSDLYGAHYFTIDSTQAKRVDRSEENYDRLRNERKTQRKVLT